MDRCGLAGRRGGLPGGGRRADRLGHRAASPAAGSGHRRGLAAACLLGRLAAGRPAGRRRDPRGRPAAGQRDIADLPFEIVPSLDVSNIEIKVVPALAQISGTLTDSSGKPAERYAVVVFSSDRDYWTSRNRRMPVPTETLADGTFRIGNLPAGDYFLAMLPDLEGFEHVLRQVLPAEIGFKRLKISPPEVILVTKSGSFPIDSISGGIAALIDIAWQILGYADSTEPLVVLIDEPENHLHPKLQKAVLRSLLAAFPSVQFICATHNPFVVTSVPRSFVYILKHGADGRVVSPCANTERYAEVGIPLSMPTSGIYRSC